MKRWRAFSNHAFYILETHIATMCIIESIQGISGVDYFKSLRCRASIHRKRLNGLTYYAMLLIQNLKECRFR